MGGSLIHWKNAGKRAIALAACMLAGLYSFTFSAQILHAQAGQPTAPKTLRSFDPLFIDSTTDPCKDFYQYACGGWKESNPVPADKERIWINGQMDDRNFYLLYTELMKASASPETPLQRQYGSFFSACMNADEANILGVKPLQPTMTAIQMLTEKRELARFLADQRYLGKGLFTLTE